jgi:hypothetical protein
MTVRELAVLTGFAPNGYAWLVITVSLLCIALVLYVAMRNRR